MVLIDPAGVTRAFLVSTSEIAPAPQGRAARQSVVSVQNTGRLCMAAVNRMTFISHRKANVMSQPTSNSSNSREAAETRDQPNSAAPTWAHFATELGRRIGHHIGRSTVGKISPEVGVISDKNAEASFSHKASDGS